MSKEQKVQLLVIVAGVETVVEGNENAPLQTVAQHALNASGNNGRPLSEWELKDEQGRALDLSKPVGSFNFGPRALLYLTLRVGVNGGFTRFAFDRK